MKMNMLLFSVALSSLGAFGDVELTIDADTTLGKIKPMHAVNNPPQVPCERYGQYKKYEEAKIPYARLHDTGGYFGGSHYVDIANIFPNFDADETNPESYDFAFTDYVLKELKKHGVEPYYRLGATIENQSYIKAYNIYPPKDFAKWARICEHIVRHYNEGWANGFKMGITYWEIWGEPDNQPDPRNNPLWKGTFEQYYDLYKITATHLKKCFPNIKVGGYSSCGFYAITQVDASGVANSSPRTQYFIEFFEKFFKKMQEEKEKIPMDFFSWHSYAGLKDNAIYAEYAKKRLTEFGYGDIEVHFNEWNPGIQNRGKAIDGANILAQMISMQHLPVDICMYYDGAERSTYCGLFDPVSHKTFKAYNAFLYFGKLFTLGTEAKLTTVKGVDGVFALAATDGKEVSLVLANKTGKDVAVKTNLKGAATFHVTDLENDNKVETREAGAFTLTKDAIVLITYPKERM